MSELSEKTKVTFRIGAVITSAFVVIGGTFWATTFINQQDVMANRQDIMSSRMDGLELADEKILEYVRQINERTIRVEEAVKNIKQ